MERDALIKLFKKLQFDNQCLLYSGSFNNDLTAKVIGLSEANQKNYKEEFKTQRRISYLMGECFQNIVKHGEKDTPFQKNADPNFFMNRNTSGKHTILSANLIKNDNIEKLRKQIDHLNASTKEELKELYKHVIQYGKISEKGGAGLGLIDMARKSGHNLDYLFIDFDDTSSIFYNQIVLNSEVSPNKSISEESVGLEEAMEFHNILRDQNILIVQKGDFSQESIIPVLNIIEKSLIKKTSRSAKLKNVYKALVELLQNISNHGCSIDEMCDGTFALSKEDENFVVSTGNYILNDKIDVLEQHLRNLNELDEIELEDLYTQVLMNDLDSESTNPGLGLINLSQISTKELNYRFEKYDDEKSFFTIHATI